MPENSMEKDLGEIRASLDQIRKKLSDRKTLFEDYSSRIQKEVGTQTFKWLLAIPGLFALIMPFVLGTISDWIPAESGTLFVFFMTAYGSLPLVMLAVAGANAHNSADKAGPEVMTVRTGSLICVAVVLLEYAGAILVTKPLTVTSALLFVGVLAPSMFIVLRMKQTGAASRLGRSIAHGPLYRRIPLLGLSLLGAGAGLWTLFPYKTPAPGAFQTTFENFGSIKNLRTFANSIHEWRGDEIMSVALATRRKTQSRCNYVPTDTLNSLLALALGIADTTHSLWKVDSVSATKVAPLYATNRSIVREKEPCIESDSGRIRLETWLLLDVSMNAAALMRQKEANKHVADIVIQHQWIGRTTLGSALALVGAAWFWIGVLGRRGKMAGPRGDFHAFLSLTFCILFLFAVPLLQKVKPEKLDVRDAFELFTLKNWFAPTAVSDLARITSDAQAAEELRRSRVYGGSPHLLDSTMTERIRELREAINVLDATAKNINTSTQVISDRLRAPNQQRGQQQ